MQNEQNTSHEQQPQQPQQPNQAYYQPQPVRDNRSLPYKLPWLAGFLSGIFPGIGQIYVGYYKIGVVFGVVFVGLITILSSGGADGVEPFFGLSMGFTWLYGIIDAARRAQGVNRALDGYGKGAVPEDLPLPGSEGSLPGGVILMIGGGFLLLHTLFDFDMEWLGDWWPAILIALGGWLVWKSRQEKQAGGGE